MPIDAESALKQAVEEWVSCADTLLKRGEINPAYHSGMRWVLQNIESSYRKALNASQD